MKVVKIVTFIVATLIISSFHFSCGSGGSYTAPIDVNTLDGKTNVPVNSTFKYTFSSSVDTSTVTSSSFFIIPADGANANIGIKTAYDPAICDATLALDATVTCAAVQMLDPSCTLYPSSDLEYITNYTICLTTDIEYQGALASLFIRNAYAADFFEGFAATFTTEGYTVGGTASGLGDGDSVVIQNNSTDDLTVSANGSFTFATGLADDATYAVTVLTQPDGQFCTVANGEGAISGENVTSVVVNCADTAELTVEITSDVSDPTNESPFEVTITFSEEASGFVVGDISVTNGAAGNFDSSANPVFTADITPAANGTVTVGVPAGVAVDALSGLRSNTAATDLSTTYDNIPPTFDSSSPADEETDVAVDTTVSFTFSEAMNTTTITTNTDDTTCSGTLQISDDLFTSCVQMTAAPVASNGNKTFTITPDAALDYDTTYKFRVTTAASDTAGNFLETAYTSPTGFATLIPFYMFDAGANYNGDFGDRATTTTICTNRKNNDYAELDCDNIVALVCYTGDAIADFLTNHGFVDSGVLGPTGTQVVSNWAELLSGTFDTDLQSAGVTAALTVWTGSLDDGTVSDNCDEWTLNAGSSGNFTQTNFTEHGLHSGGSACNAARPFLCICQ